MNSTKRFDAIEMKKFINKVTSDAIWKMRQGSDNHIRDLYMSGQQYVSDLTKQAISFEKVDELALKAIIGQKVLIDLKRHNGIGMISSMSNNGSVVELEIVDFGSLIKYCGRIMEDTYPSYQDSNEEERNIGSFITDTNGTIDDIEETFNFNLIS